MNAAAWKDYKTLPCSHRFAHLVLHGRVVCMGCASGINEEITMGLTHERSKRPQSRPGKENYGVFQSVSHTGPLG